MAFQVALVVKNSPANAGKLERYRFSPWVGKIPWKRAQQPTPIFFPGESHGQRNLTGYSPCGLKELDSANQLPLHYTAATLTCMAKVENHYLGLGQVLCTVLEIC